MAQQVKAGPPIAAPLNKFEPVHLALNLPLALRMREGGFDGRAIAPDAVGDADEFGDTAQLDALELPVQSGHVALADKRLEFSRQCLGHGHLGTAVKEPSDVGLLLGRKLLGMLEQ